MGWRQVLTEAVTAGVRSALRTATGPSRTRGEGRPPPAPARHTSTPARPGPRTGSSARYPGDLPRGDVHITYSPNADGRPDPGEVVWAWVPYEEDASRGKDRPVLVISEHDGYLVALMLTSRDRDDVHAREAAAGRYWMDIGTGDWDRRRRPSEVRLDRVLRLRPDEVRREGGRLPKKRFDEVAAALRRMHGWT